MTKNPTTWNFLTQHPAKKKRSTTLKGTTIKYFRGKPTSTYLEEQKRMEEFRKTIDKWKGEK